MSDHRETHEAEPLLRYKVKLRYISYFETEVDADCREDAIDKAQDALDDSHFDLEEFEDAEAIEVEEDHNLKED